MSAFTNNKKNFLLLAILILLIFLLQLQKVASNQSDCVGRNKIYGYKFYLGFPFKTDMAIPTDNAGAACRYAFFEGIYEASRIVSNKFLNLNKICDQINKNFPVKSWDQCFFKIGTAITYTQKNRISDKEQFISFVDDSLFFCERFGKFTIDCVAGVYTGIDLAYQDETSVYPIIKDNPFWLCEMGLGQKYKMQCYRNIVSYVYEATKTDYNKAVGLIKNNISDGFEEYEVLVTYFSSLAYVPTITYSDVQKLCVSFDDEVVRYSCIVGFPTGIDEVAENGDEGIQVVKFCTSKWFSFTETGECLRRGFFELPTTWDLNVKRDECIRLSPKKYRDFCDVSTNPLLPAYLRY